MTNAIGWFAGQSFTSADRTPASDDPQTCRMRGDEVGKTRDAATEAVAATDGTFRALCELYDAWMERRLKHHEFKEGLFDLVFGILEAWTRDRSRIESDASTIATMQERSREEMETRMTLQDLVNRFMQDGNELRYRLMDMPNSMQEDQGGNCRHYPDVGCSWRCDQRDDVAEGMRDPEIVRAYLRDRLGPALFAVLDGFGEELKTITMVGCGHADALARADATIATLRKALERAEGAIRDVQEFQTIMGDNHERGLQHCRCVPAIRRTLSAALDEKGE